jgi:hypothetical protein
MFLIPMGLLGLILWGVPTFMVPAHMGKAQGTPSPFTVSAASVTPTQTEKNKKKGPLTFVNERESLRGQKAVGVLVASIHPDAERDGLTREQLQTDVELRLRKAGIPMRGDEGPGRTRKTRPIILYVSIDTIKTNLGLYAYAIRIEANQTVALKAPEMVLTLGTTWSTGSIGTVGGLFSLLGGFPRLLGPALTTTTSSANKVFQRRWAAPPRSPHLHRRQSARPHCAIHDRDRDAQLSGNCTRQENFSHLTDAPLGAKKKRRVRVHRSEPTAASLTAIAYTF